jgi:hypothetical protein
MLVELRKKYHCKKLIEELGELIKDSIALFDDFSTCRVSGYNVQKIKRFETIILEHLLGKTNFESTFESITSSYGDVNTSNTIIYNLLCQIGKKTLDPTFANFLIVLEDKINELKKKPLKKYSYYVPARIEFQLTDVEFKALKNHLKKATGVQIITNRKMPKKILKNIKSINFQNFIKNRTILRIDTKARDYFYPIKNVDKKISTFTGTIAFSNHLFRDTEKLVFSSGDMSIWGNPIEDHLIIVEDNKNIIYPPSNRWQIIDYEIQKEVTLVGKQIWNVHNKFNGNYKNIINTLKLLSKQNPKIKQMSEEALKLYFEAITEKQLEMSFLKFWIITERILKQGGKRDDESLLFILKKIIKEKHLERSVEGLYKKRNKLVHEFRTDFISQQDRNLSKAIAESTTLFIIDPPAKIKNIQELRMLIENIFLAKEELKTKKAIINNIIKSKTK